MASLDSLPTDALLLVFALLSQRDACALGATCRTMTDAHVASAKAVGVGPEDDAVAVARFLGKHAETAYRLFSTNKVVNFFALPRLLPAFESLRHLKLSWTSVPDDALDALPPSIETLYVRRVVPARGRGRGSKLFATSSLDRLRGLKHLSLWLSAMYDEVRLDHGSELATLFVAAPTYVSVVGAPPGPTASLRVDANAIWCREDGGEGFLGLAPKTRLRAVDFSIPRDVFALSSAADVRSLSYECPSRSWVPHLEKMTNLERLFVTLDNPVVRFDDFARLPKLVELVVRARYSVGFSDDNVEFPGFGKDVKVSVFVDGQASPFHAAAMLATP